jgi:hypothetical protein
MERFKQLSVISYQLSVFARFKSMLERVLRDSLYRPPVAIEERNGNANEKEEV